MPQTWMPPTLRRFVVIFVVSRRSGFFFPKNEKLHCTIGVDVLGVETQLDFREKKILC